MINLDVESVIVMEARFDWGCLTGDLRRTLCLVDDIQFEAIRAVGYRVRVIIGGGIQQWGCWIGYEKVMMISWTSIVVSWEMRTGRKKERSLDIQLENVFASMAI